MADVTLLWGLLPGLLVGALLAFLVARARISEMRGRLAVREQESGDLRDRVDQMSLRIDEATRDLRATAERRAAAESRLQEVEEALARGEREAEALARHVEQLNAAVREEAARRASLEPLARRAELLEEENRRLGADLARLTTDHEKLQEAARHEREGLEAQVRFVEEAKLKLLDSFRALSSEVLRSNSEAFLSLARGRLEALQTDARGDLEQRQKAIEALLAPVRDTLERYQRMLAEMSEKQAGHYTSLTDQIRHLLDSEKVLRDQAGKLVHALTAPQVRGSWGEITLRRVAELAGLVEHCDFFEQESAEAAGGRLRPDMIVRLPNRRMLVVDAKAPLKAYLEAVEQVSEEGRRAKMAVYARHVRARVEDLSRKEYWDQFEDAPEFAVLFLPGEQYLGAALQEDPGMLEDAFERRVIMATPTTLIAVLKSVAYGWRQEALAENARLISDLGKQLHERLAVLVGHLQDVGRNLDRCVTAYNKAVASIESRVLVSARRFRDLGVTGAAEISELEPVEQKSRLLPGAGDDES